MAGEDTVSLRGATVEEMNVGLRKAEQSICPGDRVQMAVQVKARLEGEKSTRTFETYAGDESANKNDRLRFDDFSFRSAQGNFDGHGFFLPNPNVLATVERGFEITAQYSALPDKFRKVLSYKPDYDCIVRGGGDGAPGALGQMGMSGDYGRNGAAGSDSSRGGNGVDGGSGSHGGNGGNGGNGPVLSAAATYVRTAHYDKLLAVYVEGAGYNGFFLAPADRPFRLSASGGNGGAGGRGGDGGNGGHGGDGNPGGAGGRGGRGGDAGNGGDGGDGGSIDLVIDERFAVQITTQIVVVAAGGAAGEAGAGGMAGSGGNGGNGRAPRGQTASGGNGGATGREGRHGQPGRPGRDGSVNTSLAEVNGVFESIQGVHML